MHLSELVTFRNQLNDLSAMPAKDNSIAQLEKVKYLLTQSPEQLNHFQNQIDQQTKSIIQEFDKFEALLLQVKDRVQQLLEQEEKQWFQKSYNLYDNEIWQYPIKDILTRRQILNPDIHTHFTTRIQNYTSWQHPGLIIRPGLETFAQTMVSNDPLYLVDQHRDLLKPTVDKFSETYQRRLRCYVVNERESFPIMHNIPNNQFGLCLAYNFFNFRPVELIKQWLIEIYEKLKPGGVLIMTINDCDRAAGVILAEKSYACYTPGRMIITLAKSLGFEILYTWNDPGPITWIELKRPGELTSMRGGQTLAKIISKSVAESK